jgi:hypothetical protein
VRHPYLSTPKDTPETIIQREKRYAPQDQERRMNHMVGNTMTDNVFNADINDAFKKLGTDQPVMLHMVGAGTILPAMKAGALYDKTLSGHVMRRAFMT